jgi:Cu-processing system permease protein
MSAPRTTGVGPRRPGWVIAAHQSRDMLRKRWVIVYTGLLMLAGDLLLRLAGSGASALVSLLNVVLLLIPLIALVLGTASLYGARAFTELLLAQPIPRRSLFFGLYAGVAVPLASATAIALLAPFLWHRALDPSSAPMLLLMIAVSVLLVALFTSMSFVITVLVRDRARGLGVALLLWLALSVVYDGVVLSVATVLRDWPIERGHGPESSGSRSNGTSPAAGCTGLDGLHRRNVPRGVRWRIRLRDHARSARALEHGGLVVGGTRIRAA